ncbi:hypothetical protein ANN_15136 [Periplaneta americana]|uniref:Uncharacterized protein n=1 Tax=Periplaneta americana TaxID=6978 RepID=A0ABQ8SZT8_PERAM|nr:hypothetical protein ANN_15136 [Periplaneta americana]
MHIVLVGRPEGKRPLGRSRRRWEDNIKMDLREVGYDGRDWINLAQDRDRWRAYVRAAMNLRGAPGDTSSGPINELLIKGREEASDLDQPQTSAFSQQNFHAGFNTHSAQWASSQHYANGEHLLRATNVIG